jgi:hypothetical protein
VIVNGKMLGNHSTYLFEPGQSSYSERALYTSYNITAELLAGSRSSSSSTGGGIRSFTVGALLGNGPCSICGRNGQCTTNKKGTRCTDYISQSPTLAVCCKRGAQNHRAFRALISVRVEAATGGGQTTMLLPTVGGDWTTTQSPNLFDDLYTGEVWDNRVAGQLVSSGFWAAGPAPHGLLTAGALQDNGGVNHSAVMSSQILPPIGIRKSYAPLSGEPHDGRGFYCRVIYAYISPTTAAESDRSFDCCAVDCSHKGCVLPRGWRCQLRATFVRRNVSD